MGNNVDPRVKRQLALRCCCCSWPDCQIIPCDTLILNILWVPGRTVMARGVWGWNMSINEVDMTIEQRPVKYFCKVICHVDGSVDSLKNHEITFNPVSKGEILDMHMSSSSCWFLCVGHGGTSIIVFISDGGCLLWYAQIIHNRTEE
jgi:hypothetical protein